MNFKLHCRYSCSSEDRYETELCNLQSEQWQGRTRQSISIWYKLIPGTGTPEHQSDKCWRGMCV